MSTLEDDIARIAALRGKPAQEYQDQAAVMARRVPVSDVDQIFRSPPDPNRDVLCFDLLPPDSRAFFRESGWPLSATAWRSTLMQGVPEWALIAVCREQLKVRFRDWLGHHYPPTHPNVAPPSEPS